MSDFIKLCEKRQSCRKFSDSPVEHEKLVSCAQAARLAPSACNSQPWSFIVAESANVVAEIAKSGQQLGINAFLEGAKAFAVVVEEHATLIPGIRSVLDSQYFAAGDLGMAVAYFCLEATAQGLGHCQIGVFDREKICAALGLDFKTTRINALIAIGYPASDDVRAKRRKPLEEVAKFV